MIFMLIFIVFCIFFIIGGIIYNLTEKYRAKRWLEYIRAQHLLIKANEKFDKRWAYKESAAEFRAWISKRNLYEISQRPIWFELYDNEKIIFSHVPFGEGYLECYNENEYKGLIKEIYDTFEEDRLLLLPYANFVAKIKKFPYKAERFKEDRIVVNYDKLLFGMTKQQVSNLLGEPDFEQKISCNVLQLNFLGWAWGYYLAKAHSWISNPLDKGVIIFFNSRDLVDVIAPFNIEGLKEKGELTPYLLLTKLNPILSLLSQEKK